MRACSKRGGCIELRYLACALVILLLGAIAVPNFVKARGVRSRNSCTFHAMWIEAAKQIWAAENNKGPVDIPTDQDLKSCMSKITPKWDGRKSPQRLPFGSDGRLTLFCPAGGQVIVGPVSTRVSCSLPGHWEEANFQQSYGELIEKVSASQKR